MDDLIQSLIAVAAGGGLRVAVGLLVFAAFWVGAGALRLLIHRLEPRILGSRRRRQILTLLGGVTALGTMGVNVSALVAGLGLTGFALGFALKDAISNLLGGILILLYEPFGVGDSIAVAGLEGRVLSIDTRYTTLIHQQKRLLIPNSLLFTNTVSIWDRTDEPAPAFAEARGAPR
jgi:small-conductance mechanosensitive channel